MRWLVRVLYILWLIAGAMLFVAPAEGHSHLFYVQLRWVCFTVSICSVLALTIGSYCIQRDLSMMPCWLVVAAPFAVGAILYNPLVPLRFESVSQVSLVILLLYAIWFSGVVAPDALLNLFKKFRNWFHRRFGKWFEENEGLDVKDPSSFESWRQAFIEKKGRDLTAREEVRLRKIVGKLTKADERLRADLSARLEAVDKALETNSEK